MARTPSHFISNAQPSSSPKVGGVGESGEHRLDVLREVDVRCGQARALRQAQGAFGGSGRHVRGPSRIRIGLHEMHQPVLLGLGISVPVWMRANLRTRQAAIG
jgi:hypothetical protein